jgi:hypothetical protein
LVVSHSQGPPLAQQVTHQQLIYHEERMPFCGHPRAPCGIVVELIDGQ